MSGLPAARVGDPHVCPMATPGLPPIPHAGGPVLPAGAVQVLIGGQPAARMTDMALCIASPPAPIMKGAFPVPIQSLPAARMTDQTAHGGMLTVGCPTVLIGLAGTAGNPRLGMAMCTAAAAGRTSGSTQQSAQNCGVESSRQLINRSTNANVQEAPLLQQSINAGNASGSAPFNAATDGGTNAAQRQAILAANGVPSTVQSPTMDNLGLAMSRGQGVIANLDPAFLWANNPPAPGGGHAVTVTGVEYDDAGNPTTVIINDTGASGTAPDVNCGRRVPAWQFQLAQSMHSGPSLNVTTNPIW